MGAMNKVSKNLLFGLGGQLMMLAMSIILPRFILVSFGSAVNGVTSTITQIFTYISLLESGIGNASKNCLYKNIAEKDQAGICTTVSATKKYFHKITPIYVLCVVIFMFLFPLVTNSEVPNQTVRLIILIQGISGVINFQCTNTHVQLLIADGRNYIPSNLNLMAKTISTVFQVVLITIGFDIISVQLSLLIATITKAIIINIYVKREYSWLRADDTADIKRLKQRNAFVIHEVSSVLFQGTDVFLISLFCSLKEASVYTIYSLVYAAVGTLIGIAFRSVDFQLGTEFHRDRKKYLQLHDAYVTLLSCMVFATISAVYIVILPFVRLYTAGVTDIDYIVPLLPVLFSIIQLLSTSRVVCSNLINISGEAKNTISRSLLESAINIVASVIFVNLWGIPGVLLGTIAALLYRTNDIILYANIKVLKRKPWHAYRTLLMNGGLFTIVLIFARFYPLDIQNYLQFFAYGSLALLYMCIFFGSINLLTNRTLRNGLSKLIRTLVHKV